MEKKNIVLDLSFEFALEIIEYAELLEESRKYVVAKQLLKSGTSIGANIRESQSGESKVDFIHKLKIADKEIKETEYWLLLCKKSERYPNPGQKIFEHLTSLANLTPKIIIITSKKESLNTLSNVRYF